MDPPESTKRWKDQPPAVQYMYHWSGVLTLITIFIGLIGGHIWLFGVGGGGWVETADGDNGHIDRDLANLVT